MFRFKMSYKFMYIGENFEHSQRSIFRRNWKWMQNVNFIWACWQSARETGSRVKSLTPLLAIRILVPLWVVERLLRNGLSPPVSISVAFLGLSLVVVASDLSLAPTLLSTPAAGRPSRCAATTPGCHSTTTSVVTTAVSPNWHCPDPSTGATQGGATTPTRTLQHHHHRPRINYLIRNTSGFALHILVSAARNVKQQRTRENQSVCGRLIT